MLVTMKDILDKASAGNYAVAAPNLWTELDARAVIDAAEELRAPLILDIAYPANPDLFLLGQIACYFAKRATVPVAVNLDHGGEKKQILEAFRAGFTSVMIDRSACPFEQNVREVREIVELAHALGISVEAELGHVGMADQYETDGEAALTEPEMAAEFIRQTGVDCLAVAVGTAPKSSVIRVFMKAARPLFRCGNTRLEINYLRNLKEFAPKTDRAFKIFTKHLIVEQKTWRYGAS